MTRPRSKVPRRASLEGQRARELEGRVGQLLEASFRSGRFAQMG